MNAERLGACALLPVLTAAGAVVPLPAATSTAEGEGFDSKGIYVAAGAVTGEVPGTYWMYYGGTSVRHDATPDSHHFNGGVGRFLLHVGDGI